MTKNVLDIQTIFNKRTDKLTDRVLLSRQVTIEKEKAHPLHFLKFLFASHTNGTFGFVRHTSPTFAKPKEPFFSQLTTKCFILFALQFANAFEQKVKGKLNRGMLWS